MDERAKVEACKAHVEDALRRAGALDRVSELKAKIAQVRATAEDPDDGQAALMLAYFDMNLEPGVL